MNRSLIITTLTFFLMGCQSMDSKPSSVVTPTVVEPAPAAQSSERATTPAPSPLDMSSPAPQMREDATLRACLQELNALQQVNPGQYQGKSTELNRLLAEAKRYMSIRGDLNSSTNIMLDSAFQYRIARVCNDIRIDLTRSLLERIERP